MKYLNTFVLFVILFMVFFFWNSNKTVASQTEKEVIVEVTKEVEFLVTKEVTREVIVIVEELVTSCPAFLPTETSTVYFYVTPTNKPEIRKKVSTNTPVPTNTAIIPTGIVETMIPLPTNTLEVIPTSTIVPVIPTATNIPVVIPTSTKVPQTKEEYCKSINYSKDYCEQFKP